MDDSTGSSDPSSTPPAPIISLFRLFKEFLKIGSFAFGGPIATLAVINEQLVTRRAWITQVQFQKWVSQAKLFPGPLATLVAIRIGTHCRGPWGGTLAGLGQILPAFFLMLALSALALNWNPSASTQAVWLGLGLGAIALSVQAGIKITQPLFKSGGSPYSRPVLMVWLFSSACATLLFPQYEIWFILGSGFVSWAARSRGPKELGSLLILAPLFFVCFKASVLTFGSGIAIVPVLRAAFMEQYQWVDAETFLMGLTFSQITPGPLVILATFLGFQVSGVAGAIAATLGTFLPSFLFGTVLMPRFESRLGSSSQAQAFFQGVIPAVCGAIFGAMGSLTLLAFKIETQNFGLKIGVLGIACLLSMRTRLHPFLILLVSGLLGWLTYFF